MMSAGGGWARANRVTAGHSGVTQGRGQGFRRRGEGTFFVRSLWPSVSCGLLSFLLVGLFLVTSSFRRKCDWEGEFGMGLQVVPLPIWLGLWRRGVRWFPSHVWVAGALDSRPPVALRPVWCPITPLVVLLFPVSCHPLVNSTPLITPWLPWALENIDFVPLSLYNAKLS